MARKSAVELAIEHIDARIAPLNAELHGLQLARNALVDASSDDLEVTTPKPKRGRGKGKKGLPAASNPDDESTRMAV